MLLRFKKFLFNLCGDTGIIHFAAKINDFELQISGPFSN